MNIMTIETPDPIAFKKATTFLKKLNVKINVVEQDSVNATDDDNFEKAFNAGYNLEEAKAESKRRIKKHFDENGANIHLKGKVC